MFAQHKFPRLALVLILLIGLCAGLFAPKVDSVEAKPLSACPGGVITQWIFDGDVTATSTGSGIFANGTGITQSFAAGVTGNPDRAVSFNGWGLAFDSNDFVEFSVDTTGRSDISISFDYRSTGTGPNNLELQYSIDGIAFIPHSNNSINNNANFHNTSFNLSSLSGINNNPNFKLRLYGYGATAGTGTFRLDNVTISEICPPAIEILINEVAWMGTTASPNDEWIELHNPGISDVDLTGWRLVSNDGNPDIVFNSSTCIPATCIIPSGGYFLLERAYDNVVQGVPANLIFFGQLGDSDETLTLIKPDATIVDTANSDGGTWPAGISSPASSMERVGAVADGNLAWSTFQGIGTSIDAGGNLINGTPGFSNVMLNITPTFTPSITPSPTITLTPTFTVTPTRTITPTGSATRSVVINEIAWAGTASGLTDDEWIELYNPGTTAIDITDWSIRATDGSPNILLNGVIPAGGYFLLEKDDDNTVSDITADQIYTGNTLSNSGEVLTLYDSSNKVIDTANGNGGAWPRGSSSTYGTMERILGTADSDSAWITNTGIKRNGLNANGGNILGTPKQSNTVGPTPTPTSNRTSTPTRVSTTVPIDPRPIINEILPRPGFDWNQDGRVDVYDEFIEIKNITAIDITLNGWKLDKGQGSTSFSLPNITLRPNERIVFYSAETNLLLSDGGETVRLINPSGRIYDAYTYTVAKAEDESICRLPDGNVYGGWFDDCLPTPNLSNTREGSVPTSPDGNESAVCNLPDTIPADFFFAECGGYGADIWNPLYWDTLFKIFIQNNTTKWESFIE